MFSITILAALSATVSAEYLITNFQSTDINIPEQASHHVSFQVSQTGAVWELGGAGVKNCSISWVYDPATCFTPCISANDEWSGSGVYYARICPDSFEDAGELAVEIVETWFYKAPAAGNASIPFGRGYGSEELKCSPDGVAKVCWTEGNVETEVNYGADYNVDACNE